MGPIATGAVTNTSPENEPFHRLGVWGQPSLSWVRNRALPAPTGPPSAGSSRSGDAITGGPDQHGAEVPPFDGMRLQRGVLPGSIFSVDIEDEGEAALGKFS